MVKADYLMERIPGSSGKEPQGMVIAISEDIKFQGKVIKQDKERYSILIKGIIYEEYRTIIKPQARSNISIRHC